MAKQEKRKAAAEARPEEQGQRRESGLPGGGRGRKDRVGRTGVFPVSAMDQASDRAVVHPEPAWGQGERGAAGYEDSGQSELFFLKEELPRRGRSRRKEKPQTS